MIVDDSRAMRLILKRIVTEFGFETCEAANGREAIDALRGMSTLPDLMLVDWNMPEMNGLELIVAVRAESHMRNITLMMVTTESEMSRIVRALAAGAHEYVMKPFTNEAIVEKLELLGFQRTAAAV